MTRPITVGVDGSAQSQDAARWAVREARRRGLPLCLAHAWIAEPVLMPPIPDEGVSRVLLERTRAELAAEFPGAEIGVELVPDIASSGLIAKAAEAEMLVLGSRGRGAVMGFLLGSVGLPVIAHVERPVVVVRSTTAKRAEEGDEVVVALKEEESAEALFGFAFATAAARGAAVRAVRAWGTPSPSGSADLPCGLEAAGHEELEDIEGRALAGTLLPWRERFPGVPVVEHLRLGNAADVLLSAAAFRAGLVVVGRRLHRPVLGTRIGPVTHAALRQARSPVAVIPYENP